MLSSRSSVAASATSGTSTTSSVFRIKVFMLLKYCTRHTPRSSVEDTWQLPNPRDIIATGPTGQHAYFVHSYQLAATDPGSVIATSSYGGPVTAMVGRDNIAGTQFHPEKSQALGLNLIANFLRWRP